MFVVDYGQVCSINQKIYSNTRYKSFLFANNSSVAVQCTSDMPTGHMPMARLGWKIDICVYA